MKKHSVRLYQSKDYSIWNEFIGQAKNATFLFHRDFMEYHADRFEDYSLLVFNDNNQVVALIPAHKNGNEIFSHYGLTYGGILINKKTQLLDFITICHAFFEYLHINGIEKAHFKMLPEIYPSLPNREIDYVFFLMKAELTRRDSLSVIDLQSPFSINTHRKQASNRGLKNCLQIIEEPKFDAFWEKILMPNLKNKRNAKPVHTLEEIKYLHQKFPHNIRQFNVYHEGELVAGTTIFESENVAHPQYISGNLEKNKLGSLDYLYRHLIEDVFAHKKYFDFGISNEQNGQKLSKGMQFWKETFDSHTITQDFYMIEIANFPTLENVLI
uniref:GNAT family N-acetyltransferase n=1 Tax=Flavobacterium sp. TaxID=239 RepID=UPI004049DCC1